MELFISPGTAPTSQVMVDATGLVNQALGDLSSHLKSLNMDERRFMRKMGTQRFAYAKSAMSYSKMDEDILPRNINPQDFESLLRYFEQLGDLYRTLEKFKERIDDTMMAVGIDAMWYTKVVHDAYRTQAKFGTYDDALNALDEYNARSQKEEEAQKATETPTATPTETPNEKEVNS